MKVMEGIGELALSEINTIKVAYSFMHGFWILLREKISKDFPSIEYNWLNWYLSLYLIA